MPILPAEPDLYPAGLFDAPPEGAGRRWRVAHTKPRQEKSLARDLAARGVPFFLPCRPKTNLIRGRVVRSHVPLFTGYAFVWADAAERAAALTTNRVANLLEVPDQARLWADLRQVKALLDGGGPVTPEAQIGPGDEVEVTTGPLAGIRGRVVRTSSGRRFVVSVDFIQQGASVVLEEWMLARKTD